MREGIIPNALPFGNPRRNDPVLSRDGPKLIEDIGLTMRQVEDELAKPFWRDYCMSP